MIITFIISGASRKPNSNVNLKLNILESSLVNTVYTAFSVIQILQIFYTGP